MGAHFIKTTMNTERVMPPTTHNNEPVGIDARAAQSFNFCVNNSADNVKFSARTNKSAMADNDPNFTTSYPKLWAAMKQDMQNIKSSKGKNTLHDAGYSHETIERFERANLCQTT